MISKRLEDFLNKICDFSSDMKNFTLLNTISDMLYDEEKDALVICNYLLKHYECVGKIVKSVVDSNIELIKKGELEKLSTNDYFICFINIYCMELGISLNQSNVEIECVKYDNYYNNMLNMIPVLTLKEEKDLFDIIKNGNSEEKKKARHTLVVSNLRLVRSIAYKYSKNSKLSFEDLMEEGTLGLFDAINGFDITKGYKFSTYATLWINQKIKKVNKKQPNLLTLSNGFCDKARNYQNIFKEFISRTGCRPSLSYMIDKTGYDEETISLIEKNVLEPVSLESPIKDHEGLLLQDWIADDSLAIDESFEKYDLSNIFKEVFDTLGLNKKEYDIICYRFGLFGYPKLTLEQAGKKYNVSRERIRQVEKRIIMNIRKNKRCVEMLSGYHR